MSYVGSLLATVSYMCFLAVPLNTMYKDGVTFEDACNTAGYVVGIMAYIGYTYYDYQSYRDSRSAATSSHNRFERSENYSYKKEKLAQRELSLNFPFRMV